MNKKIIRKSGTYVHDEARLESGVLVWYGAQIASGAHIGKNTTIGNNVYIDSKVKIGKNCKIQSGASLFFGVEIKDGVFIGPHVCFTNDKLPRAINPVGKLKTLRDWKISKTVVMSGASIGANATILPGVKIGKWAMVGAGSVVTKSVPNFALVYGNPAQITGKVDKDGNIVSKKKLLKNDKQ